MLAAAVWGLWSSPVAADPGPRAGADLDGVYLALGPLGGAVHTEAGWEGAFGGEISLFRVTEQRPLAALGLSVGGTRYSDRDTGRVWLELSAGTRWPLDVAWGVSAGPTVELDLVVPPRWGAQASIWLYAGVLPYLRLGRVERSGQYVELGVEIPLPALRW